MLVLTRKLGESIAIGDDIKVSIIEIKGKQVRLGVSAPDEVAIHREEVWPRRSWAASDIRACESREANTMGRAK